MKCTKRHKRSPDVVDLSILKVGLENPSFTDEEIAKEIGMSREAVNRRKKGMGYQAALHESAKTTEGSIQSLISKSVSELHNLVGDPDPRIRLSAIALVLRFMPCLPLAKENADEEIVFKIGWEDDHNSQQSDIVYKACWSNEPFEAAAASGTNF